MKGGILLHSPLDGNMPPTDYFFGRLYLLVVIPLEVTLMVLPLRVLRIRVTLSSIFATLDFQPGTLRGEHLLQGDCLHLQSCCLSEQGQPEAALSKGD
jgi:hypothetical protein